MSSQVGHGRPGAELNEHESPIGACRDAPTTDLEGIRLSARAARLRQLVLCGPAGGCFGTDHPQVDCPRTTRRLPRGAATPQGGPSGARCAVRRHPDRGRVADEPPLTWCWSTLAARNLTSRGRRPPPVRQAGDSPSRAGCSRLSSLSTVRHQPPRVGAVHPSRCSAPASLGPQPERPGYLPVAESNATGWVASAAFIANAIPDFRRMWTLVEPRNGG